MQANIVVADISACKATIHTIDSVLVPHALVQYLAQKTIGAKKEDAKVRVRRGQVCVCVCEGGGRVVCVCVGGLPRWMAVGNACCMRFDGLWQ
jgi:hypothetical protein